MVERGTRGGWDVDRPVELDDADRAEGADVDDVVEILGRLEPGRRARC